MHLMDGSQLQDISARHLCRGDKVIGHIFKVPLKFLLYCAEVLSTSLAYGLSWPYGLSFGVRLFTQY